MKKLLPQKITELNKECGIIEKKSLEDVAQREKLNGDFQELNNKYAPEIQRLQSELKSLESALAKARRVLTNKSKPKGESVMLTVRCAFVIFLISCATTPVTGSKKLILTSTAEENTMGRKAHQEILKHEKVDSTSELAQQVRIIGQRSPRQSVDPI